MLSLIRIGESHADKIVFDHIESAPVFLGSVNMQIRHQDISSNKTIIQIIHIIITVSLELTLTHHIENTS